MGRQVARRLEMLCGQAAGGELAERAARYGVADALDRIVGAVRAGRAADGGALEADLDLLEDAFARHGIDGLTTGARSFEPWQGGGSVMVSAWVCPAGACSRAEAAEPGGPPACALTGAALAVKRFRL
ncbi:hypothetical protein AB0J57_01575 [Streptomyces sp. NPDC049837]|uniref:hypothetical protein n=1 Tax=Streptomyces sp. NPDC049837 TaxID=3155277 RepID=UPI00342342FB